MSQVTRCDNCGSTVKAPSAAHWVELRTAGSFSIYHACDSACAVELLTEGALTDAERAVL